ncbi:MAG: hypothetical protein J0H99_08795, partial [Rhodospirillales bacterium]|nr:hypothetical protein [Rhodospirillales bacterium]
MNGDRLPEFVGRAHILAAAPRGNRAGGVAARGLRSGLQEAGMSGATVSAAEVARFDALAAR